MHLPYNALEVLCSKIVKLKQTAKQFSRAIGDNDRVRLSDTLQPCREIGRLADDAPAPSTSQLMTAPSN
jgi:phosphohistidine phosphatase SixA